MMLLSIISNDPMRNSCILINKKNKQTATGLFKGCLSLVLKIKENNCQKSKIIDLLYYYNNACDHEILYNEED